MDIKTVKNLRLVLCLIASAFALLAKLFLSAAPGLAVFFFVLAVALLIADIVLYFVYYKCPWCNRLLPSWGVVVKHCPYCGQSL